MLVADDPLPTTGAPSDLSELLGPEAEAAGTEELGGQKGEVEEPQCRQGTTDGRPPGPAGPGEREQIGHAGPRGAPGAKSQEQPDVDQVRRVEDHGEDPGSSHRVMVPHSVVVLR